ncbi:urea-proton symporter DUR3-like [Elysia marginata]|uniref:Urea-proton symporter DUR3-like n=1 Tax=Elysia marginata TaxID=1093978 RepID=A0AAV4I2R4_9GAST|nr:urea-proton symporter DUR3-like [Elysia marginata]
MLVGFGGFSIILALVHNSIRKHVFHDEHNLDTTFDAGGNVSLSLTAVTVASQLFWPGDILHSATLTTKNGIAGTYWYAVGIMFNIFVFPVMSVQFKTKAPGAKTYLQIIKARFGKYTHTVFCFFAILTNLVITIGVLLAGRATIQSLTENASDEFSVLIMAALFGSYSLIGGLGTTFYVSYFNACLVFILFIVFVVKILHNTDSEFEAIGNMEKMYKSISCIKGPDDNVNNSYLTFRSWGAFMFGIIEIFVSSAVTYCDQASWQSRIAAKPIQGVWGFILAGFIWFSIPNVMATTTGMAYLALSYANGTHLLTEDQIDQGLVTPLIAEKVLGSAGGILILTMGAMALMSTGSGEVMGLSSVIVYDIYQTYIKPFRDNLEPHHCVLCGKTRKGLEKSMNNANGDGSDLCSCAVATNCTICAEDLQQASRSTQYYQKQPYKCQTHGRYREYMDFLFSFKNWCIVWVTVSMIPLGLVVFNSGIDLNWIFYSGATVTIPCFPPVVLSIIWVKATGKGLIAGSIAGLVCGVTAALVTATTYPGGLYHFLDNTVQDYTILAGNVTGFVVSLSVCIVGSLLTHKIKGPADEEFEWMKMYDIDNPLQPWELLYREDFKGMDYEERPSAEQMNKVFHKAKITAYVSGGCSIFLFAVFIPSIMVSFPDMGFTHFKMWINFTQGWAIVMAIVVVFLPPTEEIMRIVKQCRKNRDPRDALYRNGLASDEKGDAVLIKSNSAPEAHEMIVKDGGDNASSNSDVLPVAV